MHHVIGTGFNDYFLIVADFMDKQNGYSWWDRGYGSGAGCLMAYVLGITDIIPFVLVYYLNDSLIRNGFLRP